MWRFQTIVISVSAILFSCSDNNSPEDLVLQIAETTAKQCTEAIDNRTVEVLHDLQEKTQEAETFYKAEIWQPKALRIRNVVAEIVAYLQQEVVQRQPVDIQQLFGKINDFKAKFSAIDTLVTEQFIRTPGELSITTGKKLQMAFEDSKTIKTLRHKVILLQLVSQIKILESRAISFSNEQVSSFTEAYDSYSAIIAQSSSHVQPGEKIEITAGVGAFSTKAKPKITIDDSLVTIGAEGVANYFFNAPKKSGKHTIHVHLNLIDQYGKSQSINKDVIFTVAARK